ncbi:MAG: ATP-dependent DNA helicase RecG [Candidatus Magasanikbacteria bacterium]
MNLTTPITQLNRVGKILATRLKHLGVETVEDLLFYFPFRYEDYSSVVSIKDLQEGMDVTIQGKIELISNKRSPRKRKMITEALVADDSGQLRIIWFGQPFIAKALHVGDSVYLSGKVKSDMFGLEMVSPGYEKVKQRPYPDPLLQGEGTLLSTHTARIVPMYSLTTGITHKQIRFLMSQIIEVRNEIKEWLPDDLLEQADIMPLQEALKAIHFPESQDELKYAQRRLKFDELFVMQLRAEMIRQSIKRSVAPQLSFQEDAIKEFVHSLPFALTKDQKVSAWEILQDLEKKEPMNRLLEGDVGSGKTVVAAMALYNTALNGYQGVIMAPTEILAVQHYESLVKLLGDKVRLGIQTRNEFRISNFEFRNNSKISQKKEMIDQIAKGEVDVIVGTHALLTEDVQFKNLGLVIVDEQHRFGVEQRKILKEKSISSAAQLTPGPSLTKRGEDDRLSPHFLSMTATPIPRSFALTLYGDLDLSIIREMPKDRKPVMTRLVDPHNRDKAYAFIREQVKRRKQVFVVCPLIEEINSKRQDTNKIPITNYQLPITFEKKSVLAEYEKLSKNVFPDLRIGYLHGKMKSQEKDETMKKFAAGELDILVSTSVVEVGVNIPNASVMMIEGAERFGLAQLHQFRGRVGRSFHQSYCFLFTDSDTDKVKERLSYFEKTTDGFKVAEYDLDQRGPGEVYGTAQSGMMNFKLATLKDHDLIKLARDMARGIDFGEYPSLREKVEEWETSVHLE